MKNLEGKSIVLTGASSGIGRSTAIALASTGAHLHLVARREQRLEEVCEEVRGLGGRAAAHVFDVRETERWAKLVEDVHGEHGHLDILINNAGVGATKTFLDTTDEDWRWTFDINLHAMVTGTRAFLPGMLAHGNGMVVNVASLAGVTASVLTAYTASKYAVIGLSEALLLEYGDKGLQVLAVCPGIIDTEIAEAAKTAGRSNDAVGESLQGALKEHGVSPDLVARDIIRAIRRPRFLVMTPMHAKVLHRLHRMAPGVARALTRKMSAD